MKRVFLLMFVSALMVTFGFAQTPDAGSNTDPATVKGCLSGSEGNYTIAEDGTRQIFKVTSSSVDLKPHVGHDVKLVGHKASGSVSAGPADHSFAVTDVSMISEHCAAPAAAAAAATVAPYAETVIAPDAAAATPAAASAPAPDAAAPAATASPSAATASAPAPDAAATVSPSAATASTPAAETAAPAAPAATVSPSSATVSIPAVEAAAPAATASPSSTTVSAPPVETAHAARPSAHARKLSPQSRPQLRLHQLPQPVRPRTLSSLRTPHRLQRLPVLPRRAPDQRMQPCLRLHPR